MDLCIKNKAHNFDIYTLKNKSVLDAVKSDLDAFDENEKRLRRF